MWRRPESGKGRELTIDSVRLEQEIGLLSSGSEISEELTRMQAT